MEPQLRAGAAIYNAGRYHAAHDAWEDHWLDLESGTDDERFLHGLIQFTAAIHHARNGNWSGATGLARSAGGYLEDLPADYRGLNLNDVREYLATLADDPEVIERGTPLALVKDGEVVDIHDVGLHATLAAAEVFAEADGYDEEIVELACEYACRDAEEGVASSPFISLLFDFVREPDNRGIVFQRLSEHTERRRARNEDVDGLFE
jgi:hypothetical protein